MANKKMSVFVTPDNKSYDIDAKFLGGQLPDYYLAAEEITYAALKAKRDAGQLIPGKNYRIIDYVTTTSDLKTKSANHPFDIIVVADSVDTLNENARAALHKGDNYFINANLNAWVLKYTLENDKERYNWADIIDGKGIIYQMTDEFNNCCDYDFKNILFEHNTSSFSILSATNWKKYNWPIADPTESVYFYTFSAFDSESNIVDYTILNNNLNINGCLNNRIECAIQMSISDSLQAEHIIFYLPNNIFFNGDLSIHYTCANNTLKKSARNNLFGKMCINNTLYETAQSNIFAGANRNNICFADTDNINIGYNSNYNYFYNHCVENSLGDNSSSNIFYANTHTVHLGDSCSSNTIYPVNYNLKIINDSDHTSNNITNLILHSNCEGGIEDFDKILIVPTNSKSPVEIKPEDCITKINPVAGLDAYWPADEPQPPFSAFHGTTDDLFNMVGYDENDCLHADLHEAFSWSDLITAIPYIKTDHVQDMSYMFNYCTSLVEIPQLNTSNVTNMHCMFTGCHSLITIPQLDTSKVTDMSDMFGGCHSLTAIPQLDTSNVTEMWHMFEDCALLTTIPQLDTSNVTVMHFMFGGCTSLKEIPLLRTEKVTDMNYMFASCSSLITIPKLDTRRVTDMSNMFYYCASLVEIPYLNTTNVTNMYGMFHGCTGLTTIPALHCFGVTSMQHMFDGCISLKEIHLKNINTDLSLSGEWRDGTSTTWKDWTCPLEHDALVEVISNLMPQLHPQTPSKTLTLGPVLKAKLSPEEIKVATNKGWKIN